MELNEDQTNYLEFIRDNTDIRGYAPVAVFNAISRPICAHLMQRGFIGFNFDRQGYYITDRGRKELLTPPPDERAQLIEQRTALETQLAAVNARLAALEPKAGRG